MLLGTTLLLMAESAKTGEPGNRSVLLATGLIVGFGLWAHQLIVVYLIPLGIILAIQGRWWYKRKFSQPHKFALALAAIAGLYVVLGVIAFVSGGFSLQLGGIAISATAPQKMFRIAVAVLALAAFVHLAGTATSTQTRDVVRHYWPVAAGFLIGYAPALVYTVLVEPPQLPARVMGAQGLMRAVA